MGGPSISRQFPRGEKAAHMGAHNKVHKRVGKPIWEKYHSLAGFH